MPKHGEFDQYYSRKLQQIGLDLLESFKGSKKHHRMRCLTCHYEWTATPVSKIQTNKKYGVNGCPVCCKNRKEDLYTQSRTKNINALVQRGIEVIDSQYDGRRSKNGNPTEKVRVKNTNCGHVFWCTAGNLLSRNVQCGVCGPQTRAKPLTNWSKENSKKWRETATEWQIYKANVSALTRKAYKRYQHSINPTSLPIGRAGVEGAYHIDHIVPVRYCFENQISEHVCANHSNLQIINWRANVGSRNHLKGSIPPLFHQYIPSNSRLLHFAKQIQKRIFPKSELFVNVNNIITTLFDKSNNHAVLIIPLDEFHMSKKTAMISMNQFVETGISFSIIFEDELTHNTDLIYNKLRHYTKTNTSTRIHGRDCVIKTVNSQDKGIFLQKYHVQGNDNSQIAYGGYFNNQLIAMMTFTTPRVALGYKNKDRSTYADIWELSRFTTNTNYRIPGIASRLLEYFKRNHSWKEIFSFADRRWSVGNLYYKLGFDLVQTNAPDYFYIIDGVRKHRWAYRKDMLKSKLAHYDPAATEYQNMLSHGYDRIWDCGTLKFSLRKITINHK